jgi:hypothetical protein
MSRYAKIESELVVEVRDMASNFDPAEVAHKGDFRIVNQQPDPVFDPDTHILVTPASELTSWDFVVNPADVDATRKVRALTQAEIDAKTDAGIAQAERDQAVSMIPDLKAGTVSDALQQKMLARLIEDMWGLLP